MATQMYTVSGNPRLRRNQTAELNSRLNRLPALIANRDRAEEIRRQEELNTAQRNQWQKDYNLSRKGQKISQRQAKQQMQMQQKEARVGMGLEGLKLGSSILSSYGGTKSAGSLFGGAAGKAMPWTNKVDIGSAVGGSLAGFGAANMLGGKKRSAKKTAIGAGVGALAGFLGGGSGFGGGLGGAIASLF